MSNSDPKSKTRWLLRGCALTGAAVVVWFLPLFHVVSLKEANRQSAKGAFDPGSVVDRFWNEQLLKGASKTVGAAELLTAFGKDPKAAAEQFGHRLGLSENSSFLVTGTGKVTASEKGVIEITLDAGGSVAIDTGPVFGNAIRDGSGLLDVNLFANSQDFNAVSSEINRRVEETIFPQLREKATLGTTIHFVGGVDIADPKTDLTPLKLVPVVIEYP